MKIRIILPILLILVVSGAAQAQTAKDLTEQAIDARSAEKSFELVNKALEVDPEYIPAYIIKAGIYAQSGDYDDAVKECDKAIEIAPHYRNAYEVRATLKEHMGDIKGAQKDRRIKEQLIKEGKSYELEQAEKKLQRAEEALKKQQKLQGVREEKEKLDTKSDYAQALLDRAQAKIRNGDYQEAIEDFNRYQQTVQFNYRAFTGKASAQMKLNDYESAINTYSKLLLHYPESTADYEKRAELYDKIGETEKAQRDRAAIEYLHWQGKQESEKSLSKMIAINPDKKSFYLDRAYYRIQLDNYEGALSDYEKALELTDTENKRAIYYRKRDIEKIKKMINERNEQKILEKQQILDQGEALVKKYKTKNLELQMENTNSSQSGTTSSD